MLNFCENSDFSTFFTFLKSFWNFLNKNRKMLKIVISHMWFKHTRTLCMWNRWFWVPETPKSAFQDLKNGDFWGSGAWKMVDFGDFKTQGYCMLTCKKHMSDIKNHMLKTVFYKNIFFKTFQKIDFSKNWKNRKFWSQIWKSGSWVSGTWILDFAYLRVLGHEFKNKANFERHAGLL